MSTILVLSPRYPVPLIGGDRVKLYHLLKHLVQNHRVILVTFSHGRLPSTEDHAAITSIGVELSTIVLNPVRAGLASVRTLWTSLPLEIAFYTRSDFQREVDRIISTEGVDVAIAFFMRTAEYVRHQTGLKKVLIAEDCRVMYQTRSADAAHSPLQKLIRRWETRKLASYEPRVVDDFLVTTLVSTHDLHGMQTENSNATYAVVTNGVDIEQYRFEPDQSRRSGIVFCGKLDVQANHLMALSIVRDILPRIRNVIPEALVSIVGAHPLQELVQAIPNFITLHSDVPSVVPFLHSAAVFLHPHRGGSGIQNKILEAMATGCAVVTTPSGLQGIRAEHNVHCLVGHNDAELAEHTIQLLQDSHLRSRLAKAARELMEVDHTWSRIGQQLDDVLLSLNTTNDATPHVSALL